MIGEVFNEHIDLKELNKLVEKVDYLINIEKKNIVEVIIISLKSIDKEVVENCGKIGIKIWDKKDINQLLKKYHRPRLTL